MGGGPGGVPPGEPGGGQGERLRPPGRGAGGTAKGGWESGTWKGTGMSMVQTTSDLFNPLGAALRTRYYLSDTLNIRTFFQGPSLFFILLIFINVGYRDSRCYIRQRA